MESSHGKYGNENRTYQKPFIRLPNSNTFKVSVPIGNLPRSLDLRNIAKTEIYDQGASGSCSANAICSAYSLLNQLNQRPPINLCRLFIYYNSRVIHLYHAFRTMQVNGCCIESMWPFYTNI